MDVLLATTIFLGAISHVAMVAGEPEMMALVAFAGVAFLLVAATLQRQATTLSARNFER
ncbi:hypothetical protein ACOZ4I_00640 [Haloarcula salina]|uniref:hypothetical protein n=1 Tax=Haloarcula salina TaxID=1429914 RepID=UPI003C6F8A6C